MMMQSMRNAFTVDLEDWFQGLTSTNPRVDLWPTLESRTPFGIESCAAREPC